MSRQKSYYISFQNQLSERSISQGFYVKMRFFGLLTFSLLVFSISGAPSALEDDGEARIIGGVKANPGEFPEIVSVRKKGLTGTSHIMGGSILNNFWILTAAHGIVQFSSSKLVIWAGTWDMSKNEASRQIQDVMRMVIHPEYLNEARWNDVALLRLNQPLTYTSSIKAIELPKQGSPANGPAVLAGWGATANGIVFPTYPDILQRADLPIISFSDCETALGGPGVTSLMKLNICTGPLTGGLSACTGDSGSPLIQKSGTTSVQVGIVSWGQVPCGKKGNPTVYVGVSHYIDFINQHVS